MIMADAAFKGHGWGEGPYGNAGVARAPEGFTALPCALGARSAPYLRRSTPQNPRTDEAGHLAGVTGRLKACRAFNRCIGSGHRDLRAAVPFDPSTAATCKTVIHRLKIFCLKGGQYDQSIHYAY